MSTVRKKLCAHTLQTQWKTTRSKGQAAPGLFIHILKISFLRSQRIVAERAKIRNTALLLDKLLSLNSLLSSLCQRCLYHGLLPPAALLLLPGMKFLKEGDGLFHGGMCSCDGEEKRVSESVYVAHTQSYFWHLETAGEFKEQYSSVRMYTCTKTRWYNTYKETSETSKPIHFNPAVDITLKPSWRFPKSKHEAKSF